MDDDEALLSISDTKGIKMKTRPGDSITTNSNDALMKNIQQESTGGVISHTSNNLTQIGGSQSASSGGKITNKVSNGTLKQENIDFSAKDKGEVINEIETLQKIKRTWKENPWIVGFIVTIIGGIIVGIALIIITPLFTNH